MRGSSYAAGRETRQSTSVASRQTNVQNTRPATGSQRASTSTAAAASRKQSVVEDPRASKRADAPIKSASSSGGVRDRAPSTKGHPQDAPGFSAGKDRSARASSSRQSTGAPEAAGDDHSASDKRPAPGKLEPSRLEAVKLAALGLQQNVKDKNSDEKEQSAVKDTSML